MGNFICNIRAKFMGNLVEFKFNPIHCNANFPTPGCTVTSVLCCWQYCDIVTVTRNSCFIVITNYSEYAERIRR